jgi:hypothetical protein
MSRSMLGICALFSTLSVSSLATTGCAAPADEDEAGTSTGAATAETSRCGDDWERHERDGRSYTDNDTMERATLLPPASDSNPVSTRFFGPRTSQAELDWYEFEARDGASSTAFQPEVRIVANDASEFRICAFVTRSVQCGAAQPAEGPNGMSGCCGSGEETLKLGLGRALRNDTQRVFVRIQRVAAGCGSYMLGYAAVDTGL